MFETFLFISLAITFILIVFLVYHFKSRIATIEHKCDTMFEIINSIVREMNNASNDDITITNSQPNMQINQFTPTFDNKIDIVLSEDDYDSEDEDDCDSEDENDSDDEDENDSGDEDDSEDENDSDDEDDSEDENNVEESINTDKRVINMDNLQDMDTIDTNFDNDNDNDNNNNNTHIEGVDEINDANVEPLNPDNLEMHVEKVEETTNNLDDNSTVSTNTETKHSMSVFKRMTLPLLKTYVIEKGLISDPSKMKKQDLINLIETNDI